MVFGRIEIDLPLRSGAAVVLALTALALAGCRTYYGYDDVVAEVRTEQPSGKPRGERRFAVLSGENGDVSVKCFRRHTLPKRVLVEKRVVGRKEFYADFEGSYYLEQPPYNWGWNGDAWLLPKMPFLIMRLGEPRDFLYRNPLMYVIPGVGQLILVCDAVMFVGGGCVDLCLLIGKSLCSGCTIAGAWVGGRCFGWTGDWELRKHKPGALRMASYMPFVNLFCTFQTPPYMPMKYRFAHMYAEEVKLAPADQPVLSRKLLTTLTPEQIAFGSCKLTARVLCDGKVCGEREYVTDGDGNADLTELLRGGAATASSASGKLVLELHLCDRSGAPVLERRVELAAEQVLPRAAARDLRAYRRGDTDCLNKLLLSRRSHGEWGMDLFNGEFAFPENEK